MSSLPLSGGERERRALKDVPVPAELTFVIPANAVIQFKYVVRSTQNLMSCAAHVIFNWIPAFAGMTNEASRLG